MRFKSFALACAILAVATSAFAQDVAPVVVAATPATTQAIVEQSWWASLADQAIAAVAYVLTVVVPIVSVFLAKMLWDSSSLSRILFSQAMLDKLNAGIIAFIRAEAEKLHEKFGADPTPQAKEQIIAAVQPKLEAAFKESLRHFDKSGSQVTDMIRARVETALAKPVSATIPAVMARS